MEMSGQLCAVTALPPVPMDRRLDGLQRQSGHVSKEKKNSILTSASKFNPSNVAHSTVNYTN
jgi:hypothetical protein